MTSQAAYAVEKAIGHDPEFIKQDVANYKGKGEGNPAETMKALTWQGKQKVQVRMLGPITHLVQHELTRPALCQLTFRGRKSSKIATSSSR